MEDKTSISLPLKTKKKLDSLKTNIFEPYYVIIDRLIAGAKK